MIVLNTKTFEELSKEATRDLEAVGFNTSPGATAKLFMNIVNKHVADLYDTLTANHLRAFVTTSYGDALDAIGLLLQCFRAEGETDDNFRYRITRQCLVLAKANETSVRLTALLVDGVKDVIVKPYSMGAGSFTLIVLSDEDVTSKGILNAVKEAVSKVHGYGIRFNVVSPTLNYVSIKHRVFFKEGLSTNDIQELKNKVRLALLEYFSNMGVGEAINTDRITQLIMNVSPDIIQEANEGLWINGEKSLYVNQASRWFERFIVSKDYDNIVVL